MPCAVLPHQHLELRGPRYVLRALLSRAYNLRVVSSRIAHALISCNTSVCLRVRPSIRGPCFYRRVLPNVARNMVFRTTAILFGRCDRIECGEGQRRESVSTEQCSILLAPVDIHGEFFIMTT
jgi:hypothetical protein